MRWQMSLRRFPPIRTNDRDAKLLSTNGILPTTAKMPKESKSSSDQWLTSISGEDYLSDAATPHAYVLHYL